MEIDRGGLAHAGGGMLSCCVKGGVWFSRGSYYIVETPTYDLVSALNNESATCTARLVRTPRSTWSLDSSSSRLLPPDITNKFPLEGKKRVFFFFFFFDAFLPLSTDLIENFGIVFLFTSRLCHIKRSFFYRATSFTALSELLGVSDAAMALRKSLSLVIAAALFLAFPFASKLCPAYSVFDPKISREVE
ncbi:hypothetical protein BHM03_00039737 [Ensete ventricosum]|nr:hypothetical protein BHM03_00039737 [Ensete ventricosum]